MTHINKPTQRKGEWVVVVAESQSPIAKEIEVLKFGSRESAWKGYYKVLKLAGKGF